MSCGSTNYHSHDVKGERCGGNYSDVEFVDSSRAISLNLVLRLNSILNNVKILWPSIEQSEDIVVMYWTKWRFCGHLLNKVKILWPFIEQSEHLVAIYWTKWRYCGHLLNILWPFIEQSEDSVAIYWTKWTSCGHLLNKVNILWPFIEQSEDFVAIYSCYLDHSTVYLLWNFVFFIANKRTDW